MENKKDLVQYVICVNNEDYPASLEVRKVYRVVPDPEAESHQLIRVIDESGEDYLYPMVYFAYIELPQKVVNLLALNT